MSEPLDPLAAFDEAVVTTVATDVGMDVEDLRGLVARHQRAVRELPGVEDIVYEWRTGLAYDPLVERTEAAYHVVLLEGVWDEFAAHLDLDDRERRALAAVHDRQARADAADRGDDESVFDGGAPMVLTRP